MWEQREGKCRENHGEGQEKNKGSPNQWRCRKQSLDLRKGWLLPFIQSAGQQLVSRTGDLDIDLNMVSKIKDKKKGKDCESVLVLRTLT